MRPFLVRLTPEVPRQRTRSALHPASEDLFMKSALSLLLLATLFGFGCAHDEYAVDSNYHIGQINAPCVGAEPGKCKINAHLREIEKCTQIDKNCEGANKLLDDLF